MQRAVTVPESAPEAETLVRFAEPDRLPARIAANPADGAPEGAVRTADLTRDHVVIRRDPPAPGECGATMIPVALYRGVAVGIARDGSGAVYRLSLHHGDAALSVPLAVGTSLEEIAELWRAWARTLGLPMLAIDQAGNVHGALHQIGAFFAAPPSPRRRGSSLVGRRTRFSRRRAAPAKGPTVVIRDAREIIART